jgi:GTP-binding protein Era
MAPASPRSGSRSRATPRANPRPPRPPLKRPRPAPPGPPRSGLVTLCGRPNVGKSTLLNALVGEHVAIASPRPQTTRERLRGIYNHPGGSQLVFIDTPGLLDPGTRNLRGAAALARYMAEESLAALDGVDVICLVTEAGPVREGHPVVVHPDDEQALSTIARAAPRVPLVLALNKIDRLRDKRQLLPVMAAYAERHPFDAIIPVSATRGQGIAELAAELVKRVPEGTPLYPAEMFTDRPERFLVAELVREQVLMQLREEVPHAVCVSIENWEERSGGKRPVAVINAVVHVERDSHKTIVVGKGGARIKALGQAARQRIEALLGRAVYLELFVRVDEGWRDDPMALRRLGYEGSK